MTGTPSWLKQGDHPLLARPQVQEAWKYLLATDEWVVGRQRELTAIPAPPFGEGPRAHRMAELFQVAGLAGVEMDEAGNVMGRLDPAGKGPTSLPPLVLSAHLDTIFPAGTDVTPRDKGPRIEAPGISDDGRGLAALLGLVRVLTETPVEVTRPLLILASVGEEGPGNLRGVRHFFSSRTWTPGPVGFISLDGVGLDRIIHRGVGSFRFRITARGPGGHSWTDFGCMNPVHFLGRLVARFQELPLDGTRRSTLTVARWGGGTSINSIPGEAWVEVDMRSVEEGALVRLEEQVLNILEEEEERSRQSHPPVEGRRMAGTGTVGETRVEIQEIGRRPSGTTDPSTRLVRAAVEATRMVGEEPKLLESSTDANFPMSLGIPAITMGAGGTGGGIHTLGEWYQNRRGPEGLFRALLTVLLLGA